MIISFKNQATEDIFDGKNSKAARKLCPQNLWSIACRKLDQLNAVTSLDGHKRSRATGKNQTLGFSWQ